VLDAECVSVLLIDAESGQYARVYDYPGDVGLHQVRRIAIDSSRLQVVDAPAGLASAVFGAVEPEQVRLLPLGKGQHATGLLCIGWAGSEAAQACDPAILAGFADRLSVALANVTHEQMLIHQARYDALTGLANRESLAGALREQFANAATGASHAALLYIDLDEFKNINDSAGHEAGDSVLVEIAARLRSCSGAGDTVARLGGDEFAIAVAGNGDPDHAVDLAERVRRELRHPVTVSGLERRMSASIGVARIPEDGDSVDVLLRNADIAMYQAKERGRNQAVAFAPGMLRQMTDRVTLEMDLQRALENDELEMHYQPIVRTDGSIAAEALLRWGRRDGRIVNPAEFIAIAEQSDLILDIGSRVIERVCRDLAAWRDQGLLPQYVSINVSPRQLHADDFQHVLLDNLGAYGLSPRHIQLELTETSIADGERVSEVIESLAQHGFSIAIDDFGTGYSSLSHLHRYPFSVVKIDRSFVLGIPRSRIAMQLAGTIIRMAHGLDKLVIAEGVETQEQRQALLEFGCDAMQGFLFGRAAPAAEFARLLRGHENSKPARRPMAAARKTA
jgi:diguanylate cyclase (GGDEF)-like protein